MNSTFISIDPRFHFLESLEKSEEQRPEFDSAKEDNLPVIARVSDLKSWKNVQGVQPGAETKHNEEWIVTARIPFSRYRELNKLSFVKNLSITCPVYALLTHTIKNIGLVPNNKLPAHIINQRGKGVVIGIVDLGCDFAHRNFIKQRKSLIHSVLSRIGIVPNSSKRTRIHSIWHQSGQASANSPYGYGRLINRAEINKALAEKDPYAALGYKPKIKAHGTHVMDIAAGSGSSPGVAPEAKIIFVDLAIKPDEKINGSVNVLEAVKHIFDTAGDHPCVVNISLGTNGGPHDGTSLIECFFDGIVKEKPNRAIVLSAGNTYEDKSHCKGLVQQGLFTDIKWKIEPADTTPNELEIWYSGQDEFEVSILDKEMNLRATFPFSSKGFVLENKGIKDVPIMFGYHERRHRNNGDNFFKAIQYPRADINGGTWTLRLHGRKIQSTGQFHAWIERDGGVPSSFESADPNYTLNSFASGKQSIVVGSYDAKSPEKSTSSFSSAGPTRDGRQKPEISAPGHEVLAANATTIYNVRMSGTSMAAPAVTGIVAHILGHARKLNVDLSIDQIRDILFSTTQNKQWDGRRGFGPLRAEVILNVSKFASQKKIEKQNKNNQHHWDSGLIFRISSLVAIIFIAIYLAANRPGLSQDAVIATDALSKG